MKSHSVSELAPTLFAHWQDFTIRLRADHSFFSSPPPSFYFYFIFFSFPDEALSSLQANEPENKKKKEKMKIIKMGVGEGGRGGEVRVREAEHELLQKDFEGLSSVFASCLIMRRAVAADYGGKR